MRLILWLANVAVLINVYIREMDTPEENNQQVVHHLDTPSNLGYILGQIIEPETIITLECVDESMEKARQREVCWP